MNGALDFSVGAFLERGADLLYLVLLAAMIYAGVSWRKRGSGPAALVLCWAAAAGWLAAAARNAGVAVRDGLRSLKEPHETPDSPVTYETWALLGAVTEFVGGLALLVCGVALIYLGWRERMGTGKRARGPRRRK